MLGKISEWIATKLYDSLSEQQKSTYESNDRGYKNLLKRIKILLIYLSLTIVLLPVSIYLDIGKDIIIGTIAFAFMRIWNNGHHFKSIDRCFLVTLLAILSIQLISHYLGILKLEMVIVSLVLNFIFAPFKKQNTQKKKYIRKITSLIICLSSYWLGTVVVSAVFVQAIDLIHKKK